jgi:hydroxymethylpyrimidine/phosphomethylpyrimidine kinase
MGGVVPDRFFWALPPGDEDEENGDDGSEEVLSDDTPGIGGSRSVH